jgi:nuclear mRNA export protein PCID2/THP1
MGRTDEFLSSISGFLRAKDAAQLQKWLVVEPPLPEAYVELSREVKTLDIDKAVDSIDNDDAWPGFIAFMKLYLDFFRRVDYGNLLDTHTQLSALVK